MLLIKPKVQGDRKALVAPAGAKPSSKKSLTDILCQGRISHSRCHPVSRSDRALCGIPSYPRQLTYAPRRRILSLPAFDCALRGPFGGLFPARLSSCRARCARWESIRGACARLCRTLCKGMAALISASTVSYEVSRIVSIPAPGVKHPGPLIQRKYNPASSPQKTDMKRPGFPRFSPAVI